MKHHLMRGFRFALTGVANTGIHALIAVLCLNGFFIGLPWLQSGPVVANGVAFMVSSIFSYVVNTLWSFSTSMNKQNLGRFMVVSALGLVIAMLLAQLSKIMGFTPLGSVFFVIIFVPFVNFALHSLWTYRKSSNLTPPIV